MPPPALGFGVLWADVILHHKRNGKTFAKNKSVRKTDRGMRRRKDEREKKKIEKLGTRKTIHAEI